MRARRNQLRNQQEKSKTGLEMASLGSLSLQSGCVFRMSSEDIMVRSFVLPIRVETISRAYNLTLGPIQAL